jgi:hypothetical protein
MKCLFLLDLTLFWRFLGELIFDVQIRDGADTLTLIFLGLSVLYLLVPWDEFLELVNSEKFKPNDKRFENERHRFENENYTLFHPLYKEIARRALSLESMEGRPPSLPTKSFYLPNTSKRTVPPRKDTTQFVLSLSPTCPSHTSLAKETS